MLEGVLDKFIEQANEYLDPIRDEILNLDRLSFYFLGVGFIGTLIVGILLATLVSIYAFIALVVLFLLALGGVYYRNHKKQQGL